LTISCDVILDLIPLVKDQVASEDSSTIVKEHIKSCELCKAEFEAFETNKLIQPSIKDEKIILAIKRSIFITRTIILIAGGILGVALTNSMGMFYNLIIMPSVGAISFIIFKKKWYLTAIGIFLITYLWQIILGISDEGFHWSGLYYGLYYSVIYIVLIGIGVVIAILLKFAFKKEGSEK